MRLASLTFITRVGFSTSTLARTLDSLVRVSRRVGKDHFDRIAQSTLRRSSYRDPWDELRGAPVPSTLCSHSTSSGLTRQSYPSASACTPRPPLTYVQRVKLRPQASDLPVEFISTASSSTVSGLLTLFPKCFSSFLHSTCSLSVSHIYLALEEVYLPLRAAIQNNPTL